MKFTAIALSTLLSGYAKAAIFWNGQGTPDGMVPGGSNAFKLCDQLYEGKAKALCNRYCYSQDCYSPDISIVPSAVCENISEQLVALTGGLPPCVKPCPCFDADTFTDFGSLYCDSFAPDSLFVSNSPSVADLGSFFAVANNGDIRSCTFGTTDNSEYIYAAISQTQADKCLDILLYSGCLPFVG